MTIDAKKLFSEPIQTVPVAGYENASWDGVHKSEQVQIRIADALCSGMFPIYLSGLTGTGKSSIASLIYLSSRYPIWRRADDLMLTLATGRTSPEIRQEWHKIRECSCLFLDDIFFREYTAPMQQALFDIMEFRRGKPIVMTSNIQVTGIARAGIDDRISSRIRAGLEIILDFGDRRSGAGKTSRITK